MSQVHCSSSSFDRRLCKFIPFSKRNLLTDLELKPFLLGNLSPHLGVCFSLSYYKILNVLSTEVVHVWKSDCMVNTNFPLPPFQRSVAWEGREGDRGKKKSPCKWTHLPPSWAVLLTILSVLAGKQKLKIDCNFQFFQAMSQTATWSEKQNCCSV